MDESKKEKLKSHLNDGEDWAKLEAGDGVFIVKMPGKGRYQTKLALTVNPTRSDGTPFKKKELYITSSEQLEAYIKLFSNPDLMDIFSGINEVNESAPKKSKAESKGKVVGKL